MWQHLQFVPKYSSDLLCDTQTVSLWLLKIFDTLDRVLSIILPGLPLYTPTPTTPMLFFLGSREVRTVVKL